MKTTEQLENDNEAKLKSITVLRNVHARRIIEIQFGNIPLYFLHPHSFPTNLYN